MGVLCGAVLLITLTGIGCPFLRLLHIPCPTCGCTRALTALCRLDMAGYMDHQPFALPLMVAVWLMLHARLFRCRRWVYGVSLGIVAGNFAFYLWRLYGLLF